MTWTVTASTSGAGFAAGVATTLFHTTGPNTFVFAIDMSNMINGDQFAARLFTCCTTVTTTPNQVWKGTWQHVQVNPVKYSPPIPSSGIDFSATITSVAGSSTEGFPWQLLSI